MPQNDDGTRTEPPMSVPISKAEKPMATDAAGPPDEQGRGNIYGDAPGHACLALVSTSDERAMTIETGRGDRAENMAAFARAALDMALCDL